MARYYLRLPPDTAPERVAELLDAGYMDRGMAGSTSAKFDAYWPVGQKGEWDNFRVLGRDAESVDQVRREIAQAFGRDDPPDGFEIIQGD